MYKNSIIKSLTVIGLMGAMALPSLVILATPIFAFAATASTSPISTKVHENKKHVVLKHRTKKHSKTSTATSSAASIQNNKSTSALDKLKTAVLGTEVNKADSKVTKTPQSNVSGSVTAECKDGTPSYAMHHDGACSGHGGVKSWLDGSAN